MFFLKRYYPFMKLYLIISVLLMSACASGTKPVPIILDPLSPAGFVKQDAKEELAALEAYLTKHKSDLSVVADVRLALSAMTADASGRTEEALKLWSDAMAISGGFVGERAFSGWLRAHSKRLGPVASRAEFAAKLMAELRKASASPWLTNKSIYTEQNLLKLLEREYTDLLPAESQVKSANLKPSPAKGIDPKDPLMTTLATDLCKSGLNLETEWQDWQGRLTQDVRKYFTALVGQCQGRLQPAIEMLAEVVPRLAAHGSTAPLALEGYSRIIKMRRSQGERESVAPLYPALMKLWRDPAITEASLGLTRNQFEQRRIDDTLWAARARASIGDSDLAKVYAEDVIQYAEAALAHSFGMPQEQKNSLLATLAETYHFLGFRLAVEDKDWGRAASVAESAIQKHKFSDSWMDRIRFSLGMYHYLATNYDLARIVWEEMISTCKDDKFRPAIFFWASEAHSKLGNTSEAKFYRRSVASEYPLSFYSVVAIGLKGDEYKDEWAKLFNDVPKLKRTLRDWQRVDLDELRLHPVKGPLIRRAEILTSLGLQKFANEAIDELLQSIDVDHGDPKQMVLGLYASRLYAANANWYGAIATTTKLTKEPRFWQQWPEQFLVYFPRPYAALFGEVGKEKNLDPELMMGLARQESSFRSDVRSGANAFGLMQLTPPTARRLSGSVGKTSANEIKIPEALLKPDLNIRLGAAFISELMLRHQGDRSKVFAAYNAGGQTVENWIERRLFEDNLVFIELIPYQETRDYVKGVWRNEFIYKFLSEKEPLVPNK
jgi:hypothetical protein